MIVYEIYRKELVLRTTNEKLYNKKKKQIEDIGCSDEFEFCEAYELNKLDLNKEE